MGQRIRHEPPRPGVGPTVRRLREARGLSLKTLSASAKMSKGSLSMMERDLYEPTFGTIFRVAAALKLLPTELIREWQDDFQKHPDSWRYMG